MIDYWERRFEETGADGVDFTSLLSKPWDIKQIYDSKTREEMLSGVAYPRTNYFFWKLVNGKKVYITEERDKRKPGEINPWIEKTPVFLVIDNFAEAPVAVLKDRATAEEICMSYIEEAAWIEALQLYGWKHHWTMERAVAEGWNRNKLSYSIKEDVLVEFIT